MDNEGAFWHHFANMQDPRMDRTKRHKLVDILFIAVAAVIAGADTFVEVQEYGKVKHQWLKGFLELPHGIASHDTFGRVFSAIDPQQFKECFLKWIRTIAKAIGGEVIALDGKTARHSFDRTNGKSAIHVVSAWSSENRIILGQVKVDEKSNEITAIPELLSVLEIQNCVITIDAMGCQRAIAEMIQAKGADYVLALKGNQGTLREDVELFFEDAEEHDFRDTDHDYYRTFDKDHGRIERREYWSVSDLDWLEQRQQWTGLRTIGMVRSHRIVDGEKTVETRHFISSLGCNAEQFGHAVRQHWGIENSLHWVLDIAFREDESRIRKGHAAENFGMLRHIALNLLKNDKLSKIGTSAKRKKAGWDNDYLLQILCGV